MAVNRIIHRASGFQSLYLIWIFFVILQGCDPRDESASDAEAYSLLTDDEKRLPENALLSMKSADGLSVSLFAAEPMVTNPTNISIDMQGRVWVCEAYNYDVSPQQEDKMGDRIIVLEDTDADGKADKRTVFYQGTDITTPLGILALGNKVYVTRSPNILVFTDEDGDLVADRKDTLFTNLGRKGDHSAHALLPGPDGKFYFSMGNHAGEIHNGHGPVHDKGGTLISQHGSPYWGGMVLRFEEGSDTIEVLGHNFRNNYEPGIDSYGSVWQSDNDDDGNASCRINFVMPYGNYGYLDEMTGASWTTNRINLENEIPDRHWHQNDPGVVPNVLITGAGSPAGMTVYEGELLPAEFNGAIVHAEPYYNVVRAYLPQTNGAGYTATIKNILRSDDQWFRPVDVATAGDGSLFVADWYDPILGGGAAGDANRGRIYRVSRDASHYAVPEQDLSTVAGAINALKNANPETRYRGLKVLEKQGSESLDALLALWHDDNPVFRVRALWALGQLDETGDILREALKDSDPNIRIAAVRSVQQTKAHVIPYLSLLANDKDVQVRRTVATALRYVHSVEGASLWTQLAQQYSGMDRWYLEALGIGADLHPDLYFDYWQSHVTVDLTRPSHRDIIWRSRSSNALPWLTEIIRLASDTTTALAYFRSFDFHAGPEKNRHLSTLLTLKTKKGKEVGVLALRQLDTDQLVRTPAIQSALEEALLQTKGTITFVDLVRKYNLISKGKELLSLAIEGNGSATGTAAIDLLIKFQQFDLFRIALSGNDSSAIHLLHSMKGRSNKEIQETLSTLIKNDKRSLIMRQEAMRTLGSSWPGEERLLQLVKENEIENTLKPVAGSILFTVYRSSIQREAAQYLPQPATKGEALPPIKALLASSGHSENGKVVFKTYCVSCHRVRGDGVKFGPELSQIGSKLSREGLFRAILFPSDGISNGYESTKITLKDNTEWLGIIASETETEIEILVPGGTSAKISTSQVKQRESDSQSLMPALAGSMSQQSLVDLVAFLSDLKAE